MTSTSGGSAGADATGTTVAGAAGTTTPGTEPVQSPVKFDGYLQYPDSVSASYPVTVTGGTLQAELSWSTSANLTLAADCPGGTSGRTGGSVLTLVVAAGSGTCTVTVSEPSTTSNPASYVLSVSTAEPGSAGGTASGPTSTMTSPAVTTGAA